jgi:hypothetical protein
VKYGDTVVVDFMDDEFKFYAIGKVYSGADGETKESVLPAG